ncbi:hypothetical protein ACWFR1_06755 [Streptomyces sp. NPDC055103]
MDDLFYEDVPPAEARVPLLTVAEGRAVVAVLSHFADDSEEGRAAGGLAHQLAMRIPSQE